MPKGSYQENLRPSLWLWFYLAVATVLVAGWLVSLLLGKRPILPVFLFAILLLPHPFFALSFIMAVSRSRIVVRRDGIDLIPAAARLPKHHIPFKAVQALVPVRSIWRLEDVMQEHDVSPPVEFFPRGEVPGRWLLVYEWKHTRKGIVFRGSEAALQAIRRRLGSGEAGLSRAGDAGAPRQ